MWWRSQNGSASPRFGSPQREAQRASGEATGLGCGDRLEAI